MITSQIEYIVLFVTENKLLSHRFFGFDRIYRYLYMIQKNVETH
jgi:hypothetical protein